jgi:hypothetical protein
MNQTSEEALRRLAELEAENARLATENAGLRKFNELLQTQRKEYLDIICGPVREEELPTEEQMAEIMKTRVPADLILRDLDEILQSGAK